MKFVRLDSVTRIDRTIATSKDCASLPYIGLEHIEKDSGHLVEDFTPTQLDTLAVNFKFSEKHVLYGKLRPYLNKVYKPEFSGVCSTEILPILPNEAVLDRDYLWAFLLNPNFVAWATNQVSGANLPRLDPSKLAEYPIPLPPITEQIRIASILRKADRIRRLRRYARKLSDGYLQSVFLEMFGDKKNHEWQKVNFYTICKKITDGTHDTPQRVPSGIPFITSKNIRSFEIDLSILEFVTPEVHDQIKKRCFPKIGDILFTNIGANIGNAVVNSLPFEFSLKNVALIQPNPHLVDSYYLESLLNNPEFRNNLISVSSSGGVQPFISLDVLRNAIIKIPPYDLQQKYHQIAAKFIKNKKILFEAERQAEQLFQSLLHQAFEEQDR